MLATPIVISVVVGPARTRTKNVREHERGDLSSLGHPYASGHGEVVAQPDSRRGILCRRR